MRSRRYSLVVAVVIFLFTAQAGAQGLPTGSIGGSVTAAADGQRVPGVTITARSPALQGFRQTVSASNGEFLLPKLPPGAYTIEFQLQGFQSVTRSAVRVGTAQRQEIAIAMTLESVSEEILVTASSERVSTSPQSATTITRALIDKLPIARTFESAVLLTPDVYDRPYDWGISTAPGGLSIAGAEFDDNAITIDGVSPQENWLRQAEPLYVEDAVAEVTTLSSGVSAEYGFFAGGMVSVLTRSGGNTLSGSLRSTLYNDSWSDVTPAKEDRVSEVTPTWEATLGGPLVRDRLWLFSAGRWRDRTRTSVTAPPTSLSFPTEDRESRYNLKLTASPFSSHTLTLALSGLDHEWRNMADAIFPSIDLASLYDQRMEWQLFAANYTSTLSDTIVLEAHYGQRSFTGVNGSSDTDLYTGTPIFHAAPWLVYHAPILCSVCQDPEMEEEGTQEVLKATWFVPTRSLGTHTLAFGGESYQGSSFVNNYQSGTDYWVMGTDVIVDGNEIYPVLGPETQLWFTPILVPAAWTDLRTYSAFVNDTWNVYDRLTLSLGVRWDRNDARDAGGALVSDEDSWSPRLGVAWDPRGDGAMRLTASYAHYASLLSELQIYWTSSYGMQATFIYPYDGPPINNDPGAPLLSGTDALRRLFDWFGITSPGQFPKPGIASVSSWVPGVNIRIQDGLESKQVDEVTVGVNGSIGSRGSYRIDALEREYGNFYDLKLDTTTGTAADDYGNVYDLAILTNADDPWERRHRALKANAQIELSPAIMLGGSWTWSRTWGNRNFNLPTPGLLGATFSTYPEYWELSWYAPVGDLPEDVRHRARLWATWDLRSLPERFGRLNISPLFSLDTGQPYGEAGGILIGDYVANPGYITSPNEITYWFTNRDAYRTPTVTHLDVALTWSLRVRAVELFVQPRVINVFNNDEIATSDANYIDTGILTAYDDGSLAAFDPFHEKPVEGTHYRKSATFGQALRLDAYQQPRTFTISLGARF